MGTKVYPNVNAHNHQHLFSLRLHSRIDGDNNSAATSDAKSSPFPTGSNENMYGNAFYCDKKTFNTVKDGITNFEGATARTWDIFNPNSVHKYSGKAATYKLVSTFCSPLLAQEGSLVRRELHGLQTTLKCFHTRMINTGTVCYTHQENTLLNGVVMVQGA